MAKISDRSKTHSLIHVESIDPEYTSIDEFFTNKFDYVLKSNMYKAHQKTLAIYDLYRQIIIDSGNKIIKPIITLSPDSAISGSTIAGVAEKFMYSDVGNDDKPCFKSSAKVIYIDSSPDLSTKTYSDYSNYPDSVLSDSIGLTESSYTLHRIDIQPSNIYLVGVNEDTLADAEEDTILTHNIQMFSLQTIRKKGIDVILQNIIDECKFDDVHVVIDLSCMSIKYAPSVYRSNHSNVDAVDDGFDFDQMKKITEALKKLTKLHSIDITGYNFGPKIDSQKFHASNIITVKTIEMICCSFVTLKKKSINIFNDESRFLIWKPLNDENLIGWLILRNMDIETREQMIKAIGDDDIKTISITDDDGETYDALVTVTTLKEQNEKSYFAASSIYDCCLYPGEKLNMTFEILNTPQTIMPVASKVCTESSEQTTESSEESSVQTFDNLIKIETFDDSDTDTCENCDSDQIKNCDSNQVKNCDSNQVKNCDSDQVKN
jgi:arginase family enzyme